MRPVRMQRLPFVCRHHRAAHGVPAIVAVCAMLGLSGSHTPAEEEAAPSANAPFQPGEISIGEPVTLPFGAPAASSAPAAQRSERGTGTATARTGDAPTATTPSRSGWLGMTVAESNVPGRWRVDEVAAGGPAELAGIRAGDELRAVNGVALRNADEVAQALTAIVADQTVRVAIGRGDEVSDVLLRAAPRPTVGPRTPAAAQPAGAVPEVGTSAGPVLRGPAPAATPPPLVESPPPVGVAAQPSAAEPVAVPAEITGPAPPVVTTPGSSSAAGLPSPVGLPAPVPLSSPVAPPTAAPLTQPPFAVPAAAAPALPPPPDVVVPQAAAPPAVFESSPAMAPRFRTENAAPSFADTAATAAPGFIPASPSSPGSAPALPARPVERLDTTATTPGRRTALGVRTIPIDPITQARFQLSEPAGAYVIGVVQDLPASRAGVPPGSVIVAIDERPVHSPTELTSLVTSSPVDRPITVRFLLPGGAPRNAEVVLQAIDPPLLQALGAEDTLPRGFDTGERVARRPIDDTVTSLRREVGILRESLQRLERRLEGLTDGRR